MIMLVMLVGVDGMVTMMMPTMKIMTMMMKKVNHSCAHLFFDKLSAEGRPMLCLMKAGTLHERSLQTATADLLFKGKRVG